MYTQQTVKKSNADGSEFRTIFTAINEYRANKNLDALSHEEIHQEFMNIVTKAAKFGGKAFGGSVRGYFAPKELLNVPLDCLTLRDIDFWFTSSKNSKKFINSLVLKGGNLVDKHSDKQRYPIQRKKYMTFYRESEFLLIDVVVFPTYPVCDFSVNLLSYDGDVFEAHQPFDVMEIVKSRNELLYASYQEPLNKPFCYERSLNDILTQIRNGTYDLFTPFETLSKCEFVNSRLGLEAERRIMDFGHKLSNERLLWPNFNVSNFDEIKEKIVSSNLSTENKRELVLLLLD